MNIQRGALLCLFFGVLCISSCDNSFGVFAGIQQEIEQRGSDSLEKAIVTDIISFKGRYYAAGTKLYSRGIADSDWEPVALNGDTGYLVPRIATDGVNLYIACIGSGGTPALMYTSDGAAWTALGSQPSIAGLSAIDGLYKAGSTIFVQFHGLNTDSKHVYSIYVINGTAVSAAPLGGLDKLESPMVGIAQAAGRFWYLTTTKIFSGNALAAVVLPAATQALPGPFVGKDDYFTGIGSDGTKLYIGKGDSIWATGNGTAWTSKKYQGALRCFVFAQGRFLAGYDDGGSSGYLEGPAYDSLADGKIGLVTLNDAIYGTTLSGKPINTFWWDQANNRLFAAVCPGTKNRAYGLYSSSWDGTAWSGWSAE